MKNLGGFNEDPFTMANLHPDDTGLPFVVWIYQNLGSKHDVWVSISPSLRLRKSEMVSVSIRPNVRIVGKGEVSESDLALLTQWIELNRDVLIGYWNREIEYTADAFKALKPVKG